jgi:hypothetical protein
MRTFFSPTGSGSGSGPGPGPGAPRRRRAPMAAAAAALLAVAAAACGSSGGGSSASDTPDGTPPSTSATATATATGPGSGSTAPVAPAPTTSAAPPATTAPGGPRASAPPAGSARCTVTDLKLRIGRGDHGAGQIYYPLTFTNVSGHTCVLDGYPGVSLLRGDGSVIGRPAGREGGKPLSVRLAPGRSVEADLHTLNQGVRDGGCWHTPTLLRVYPPGSTDSMTLATAAPVVCGDTFGVGPVH